MILCSSLVYRMLAISVFAVMYFPFRNSMMLEKHWIYYTILFLSVYIKTYYLHTNSTDMTKNFGRLWNYPDRCGCINDTTELKTVNVENYRRDCDGGVSYCGGSIKSVAFKCHCTGASEN